MGLWGTVRTLFAEALVSFGGLGGSAIKSLIVVFESGNPAGELFANVKSRHLLNAISRGAGDVRRWFDSIVSVANEVVADRPS